MARAQKTLRPGDVWPEILKDDERDTEEYRYPGVEREKRESRFRSFCARDIGRERRHTA